MYAYSTGLVVCKGWLYVCILYMVVCKGWLYVCILYRVGCV